MLVFFQQLLLSAGLFLFLLIFVRVGLGFLILMAWLVGLTLAICTLTGLGS